MDIKVYNINYGGLATLIIIQLISMIVFMLWIPKEVSIKFLVCILYPFAIFIGFIITCFIISLIMNLIRSLNKDKSSINENDYREAVKEIKELYSNEKIPFRLAVEEVQILKDRYNKFLNIEEDKNKKIAVLDRIALLSQKE